MPELKNLFIKGKMNKDLDERLLPQGEYRDALNIDVSYSEGSNVGALQNILGNGSALDSISLTSAACIGSVRDTENDKIYWFITSDSKDLIVELDGSTISPIVVDTDSILNFSTNKDNYITGVNVLDEVLYFTDNLNEPKQVDINYWKTQSNGNFNATTSGLSEDRITVIKKAPLSGPRFEELESSLRGGNGTIGGNTVKVSLNIEPYEIGDTINIYDGAYKASDETTTITPNWQVNDIVEFKSTFEDEFGLEKETVVRLKFIANNSGSTPDDWELLTKTTVPNESIFYTGVLEEDEALFELKFPRFAYRYKYRDGQYSKMSPFGEVGFIPGDYDYTAKKGFNNGMVNTVRKLTIKWFTDSSFGTVASNLVTPASNNYAADIEEIEILYKDSVSANVYIVDAIKKDTNGKFNELFEVKDEQIFKATASNQLLRTFDSVPRKAKSQEIVANRLIYGNYLHNFNFTDTPVFNISTVNYSDTFGWNKSIKSGRTYQIGVTFQDNYSRETPVFTDKTGILKVPYSKAELKQKFQVSTTVTPPTEATHFKYYVKEVSEPYYNACLSDIYEDTETGYIYCAFPSSETNKISENDILILKKQAGNSPYKITSNNKFKVLDKNNDPPNFLTEKEKVTFTAETVRFAANYASGSTTSLKQAGLTPVPGHNTVQLETAKPIGFNDNIVAPAFLDAAYVGAKLRFIRKGTIQKSDIYTIKSVETDPDGAMEAELTFEEQFGEDVNVIYTSDADDADHSCSIQFVTIENDTGNPAYAGKFFVKLDNSSQLKEALIESDDEATLVTLASTYPFDGVDDGTAIRQHIWTNVSTTSSALSAGTYHGQALESGYHLIIRTDDPWTDSRSKYLTDPFGNGLQRGNYIRFSGYTSIDNKYDDISEYPNYKMVEIVSWENSSHKYYAIKFNKLLETNFPATSVDFVVDVRSFSLDGNNTPINPPIFEIEPEDGVLDIYYEDFQSFPVSELGNNQVLEFQNCFSFGNGVESDRVRDDYNAPTLGKGVRVSTVFEDNYQEERLKTGLIYSGIYNSKNGVNRLNQFIIGEKITKDLNPEYGSIQLLHTRDTDIIAFCEDKLVKIFANKDALFNADGNSNLVSTNLVLGQAVIPPTFGAYGISKNPESFVDHTYRGYFTDKNRGKVLRLSIDGVTEISNYGMKDYFKDKLSSNSGLIIGSFDENKGQYNVTFSDDTVSFSESVNGWPSRKSFIPESGVSLNNVYYTFKDGHIYKHDSETRNTFYGTKTDSQVTLYLNNNAGNVKNFRTLNYQGDSDWAVQEIKTEQQTGNINSFINKENIYYNYISGETQSAKADLDLKSLNVQGLGTPSNIDGNNATFTKLNASLQVDDKVYNNSDANVRTVQSISGNTITLDGVPTNAFNYFAKDNRYNTSGLLGYYLETTLKNSAITEKELYSVGSEVSLSS